MTEYVPGFLFFKVKGVVPIYSPLIFMAASDGVLVIDIVPVVGLAGVVVVVVGRVGGLIRPGCAHRHSGNTNNAKRMYRIVNWRSDLCCLLSWLS